MADDSGNEDQWLYGDSTEAADNDTQDKTGVDSTDENVERSTGNDSADKNQDQEKEPTENDSTAVAGPEPADIPAPPQQEGEEDEAEAETKDEEGKENGVGDDDDDSDEDDVHVIINDIKTSPIYTSLNIKRGGLLTSSGTGDKLKQPGKFSIEEFEAVGSINGVPAHEFNLDSVEDKPWRKPGADITDYFNYGFNEETWRAYCERQKRLRIHESGVGLAQLGSAGAGRGIIPVAITNDNSKYSGFMGPKKAGPPPGRKMAGTIDVIGVGGLASRRNNDKGTPPKENVIQVMTADRREYSRKPFPDMSVPPPATFDLPPPPHGVIPTTFPPPPAGHVDNYAPDFYPGEPDPYYQAYEPTQDSQWKDTPSSQAVKVMTPRIMTTLLGSVLPPDTMSQDSRGSEDASLRGGRSSSRVQDDKELMVPGTEKEARERKDRGERAEKERHRDRSHRRRDRSRSRSTERRSRRHKSRSRSPGHRSHRKKKSRHAEREKSKEESE